MAKGKRKMAWTSALSALALMAVCLAEDSAAVNKLDATGTKQVAVSPLDEDTSVRAGAEATAAASTTAQGEESRYLELRRQASEKYDDGCLAMGKDDHRAETLFKEARDLFEQANDYVNVGTSDISLGSVLGARGQMAQALSLSTDGIRELETGLWLTKAKDVPQVPAVIRGAWENVVHMANALPAGKEKDAWLTYIAGKLGTDKETSLQKLTEASQLFAAAAMRKQEATCLYQMADIAVGQKQNGAAATENFEAAYRGYAEVAGCERMRAICLLRKGISLSACGRDDQASEDYARALKILLEDLPLEKRLAGAVRYSMACVSFNSRDYPEAFSNAQQALALFSPISSTERNKVECHLLMGHILSFEGRLDEAAEHCKAGEALCTAPDMKESQSLCLFNLGTARWRQCRYPEALDSLNKASEVNKNDPGGDGFQVQIFNRMGDISIDMGDYDKALGFYESARKTVKDVTGPDRDWLETDCVIRSAKALVGQAALGMDFDGKFVEAAILDCDTALARLPQGSRQDRATCLSVRGNALYLKGRRLNEKGDTPGANALVEQGIECFAQARDALTSVAELEKRSLAHGISQLVCGLAMGYAWLGEFDRAVGELERQAALPDLEPNSAADIQRFLGRVLAAQGKRGEALEILARAYEKSWDMFVPNFPVMSKEEKETFCQMCLPSVSPIYTLALVDGTGKSAVLGLEVAFLDKGLIERATQRERTFLLDEAPGNIRDAHKQLVDLQQEQASLLLMNVSGRLGRSELARNDYERLRVLNEQIPKARETLARGNAVLASAITIQGTTLADVAQALGRQGSNAVLLEYVKFTQQDPASVSFIAGGQGGIEHYGVFVLCSGEGMPVGIDLGPARPIEDAVGALRSHIEACQDILPNVANEKEWGRKAGILRGLVWDSLAKVIDRFRVENQIQGPIRLFIAPDEDLFVVPFEALPLGNAGEPGRRYLVEDFECIYLDSGTDLLRFEAGSSPTPNPSVVIAGPDYDLDPIEQAKRIKVFEERLAKGEPLPGISEEQSRMLVATRARSREDSPTGAVLADEMPRDYGSSLTAIPEDDVALFANAVKAVAGTDNTVLFSGANALERAVRSLRSPRILAILTHGQYLTSGTGSFGACTSRIFEFDLTAECLANAPRTGPLGSNALHIGNQPEIGRPLFPEQILGQSPLLRSMLAMAGIHKSNPPCIYRVNDRFLTKEDVEREGCTPDETIPVDDGWLTAQDVTEMDLRGTELVVLAACETALGDVQRGRGVAGLRRAFGMAGAQSMVMSEWRILSEEYLRQMQIFLNGWLHGEDGPDRYQAFRASQIDALRRARESGSPYRCGHPYYWAGLVYIGNPGEAVHANAETTSPSATTP